MDLVSDSEWAIPVFRIRETAAIRWIEIVTATH